MPSASAKLEKQASFEASDVTKQILNVLEKKVRNLEKRKTKLDTYKQECQEGKLLNEDQKNAVKKYDEVIQTLEFAKELQRHVTTITQEAGKAQKKQAKREQMERQAMEVQRMRELLVIQDVLNNMGLEHVRRCFLTGLHGAPLLTEENLNQLDEVYKYISPSREPEEGEPSYEEQLTQSSEHLLSLLDGKNKEVLGTTYKELKDLIMKIHECGFLSSTYAVQSGNVNGGEETEDQTESEVKNEFVDETEEEYVDADQAVPVAEILPSCPPIETVIDPISVENEQLSSQRISVHPGAPHVETFFATPYAPSRPLSSEFNFLQESQIDLESPAVVDPAVVAAHPITPAPSLNYATQTPESVPVYQAQHSTEESSQRGTSPQTIPSSQFTQANPSIQPQQQQPILAQQITLCQSEYNQPIPSQTFTNQNFASIQSMGNNPQAFAGQAIFGSIEQTLHHMGQTVSSAGPLTPPSSDATNVPSVMSLGSQQVSSVGVETKKHSMNVNAVIFESSFKQPASISSTSPTPDQNQLPLSGNTTNLPVSLPTSQANHFTPPSQSSQQSLYQQQNSSESLNEDAGTWHSKNQSPGSYPHQVNQQTGGFQNRGGFNGNNRGNRGGRGGRGGNSNGFNTRGGRTGGNYNNNRGVGTYQNYRENQGSYFQSGYSRDGYSSGGQNNYSNGYKRASGSNNGNGRGSNTRGTGGNRGNAARGGNIRGKGTNYSKGNQNQ